MTIPMTPNIVIGLAYATAVVFITHRDQGFAGKLGSVLLLAGLFLVVNTTIRVLLLIKLVEGKLTDFGAIIGFFTLITWGLWGQATIYTRMTFLVFVAGFDYYYLKRKLAMVAKQQEIAGTRT